MKLKPIWGFIAFLLILGVGIGVEASIEDLTTPKQQPQIDKLRLVSYEVRKNTIAATAAVGYIDAETGQFIPVAKFEVDWTKTQVQNNLTPEEVAALLSVRNKVKLGLLAKWEAQ